MPLLTRRRFGALSVAIATCGAAPALDLGTLMARMAAVRERHALFREEKRFSALSQTLVSTGRLFYRHPSFLEKRTEAPLFERLVVDADQVTIDTVEEGRRTFTLGQAPELRALVDAVRAPLSGDLPALRRSFEPRLSGSWSAWSLDLTPLEDRVVRMLRRVSLSGSGTDVTETLSIQANGDEMALAIRPLP